MFDKYKKNSAASRLMEEQLYAQALNEVESGLLRSGLWAKALANTSGDEQKSRGLYLKYRVQAMLDEAALRPAEQEEYPSKLKSEPASDISDYWSLSEFSNYKGIPKAELIKMIQRGSFQGRLIGGSWYVHKSEFKS